MLAPARQARRILATIPSMDGLSAIDDGSRVLVKNIAPDAAPLLADHLRGVDLADFEETPSGQLRQFEFAKVDGVTAGAIQSALDFFAKA
jgi:hypothetical protein